MFVLIGKGELKRRIPGVELSRSSIINKTKTNKRLRAKQK